jgi:hypothetical protein
MKMSLRGASPAVSLALRWLERRLVREEIYYTVWFNQPVGLAIGRRIYAPLYSGAELYQVFESSTLFEPRQARTEGSTNLWFEGIKPDFRIKRPAHIFPF